MLSDTLIAALPGAIATVVAGSIGAYAVLNKDSATQKAAQPPDPNATVGTTQDATTGTSENAKAKRGRSRHFALIVAGSGLLLGGAVILFAYYLGSQHKLSEDADKLAQRVSFESKSYSELIKAGLSTNKPYIIPSIVMLVNVEKSSDGQTVLEQQRTVYQIHALTDISLAKKDQWDLFKETYSSRHRGSMLRIPGSDKEETPNPDLANQEWVVRFDDSDGERQVIMTGVEHSRPFKEDVPGGLCMFPEIATNEECFCYPNGDDVIGELMIIVQSKTLNLNAGGAARGALKRSSGVVEPIEVSHWDLNNGDSVPSTVVARFPSFKKGDYAGVKVRWSETNK